MSVHKALSDIGGDPFGILGGGGSSGGFKKRDVIRRILEFLARRRIRQGEQADENEFKELQDAIAQEAESETAAFAAREIKATDDVLLGNLADSEEFRNPDAVAGRFSDFADPLRSTSRGILSDAEREGEGLVQGFRDIRDQGFSELDVLERQHQQRTQRLLAQLEGLGDQERRDIGREFAALGGSQQVQIGQLGLAGTAAARGSALGVQVERTEAFGRLDERIRGERLDLDERLSGETLDFQTAAFDTRRGLSRDVLGAQSDVLGFNTDLRLGNLGFETELGATGLDFQESQFAQLQADRERSLLRFDPRRDFLNRRLDQKFDRVQRLPPRNSGLSSEIAFQRGLQGA